MKKLIVLWMLVLLLMAGGAFAQTVSITWKQAETDLPYVQEWVVYMGDAANPTTELVRIPYDGTPGGSFVSNVPITVSGTPGTTVQKYFALAAVSKNGNVTARVEGLTALTGGVNYLTFPIPFPDVSAPFEVLIKIVVQ